MSETPARARLRSFHELMQWRARRILLVSSLYDSFIMSEEGHLQETLLGHFRDLNRKEIPDLLQVSSWNEALALLRNQQYKRPTWEDVKRVRHLFDGAEL